MASGRDRFYFPPPLNIDDKSLDDNVTAVAAGLATQIDVTNLQGQINDNEAAIAELASVKAVSPVTPLYVADLEDMASVPRASVIEWYSQAVPAHNHDVTGSTAQTNSAGLHLHAAGTLATATGGGHTPVLRYRTPLFTPEVQKDPSGIGGKVYYWPVPVDRAGLVGKMSWIVGADASLLNIVEYEMALCVYNPDTGAIEKVWNSPNLADSLSSTTEEQETEIDMGLTEAQGTCTPGQLLFQAHRQRAQGLLMTPRSFAYAPLNPRKRPTSRLMRYPSYVTSDFRTSIASSVQLTDLIGVTGRCPWGSLSVTGAQEAA